MRNFCIKNDLIISLSLISILTIFIFLPFFIYTPLVQLSMDSFDYSYLAKLIYDGNLPASNLKIDLPIGYPTVIYFIKSIGLNFNHLVFFQLLIYLFSFLFLCYQLSKFTKFGGAITLLTFFFYSLNSYTIRHIFRISPDSFYTSFLILLVAGLFFYFRTKNRLSLIVILLSISGAILFRSNGIYLFFIIVIIFSDKFRKKDRLRFFLICSLTSLLMLSLLNYYVKGEFAPCDSKRIVRITSRVFNSSNIRLNKNDIKIQKTIKDKKLKSNYFVNFLTSFLQKNPSYYYSLQKSNYDRIMSEKTFSNLNQRFFDGRISVSEADKDLLKFMFNNSKSINYDKIREEIIFENHKKNFWIYSIYVFQELFQFIGFYPFIYFLFFLSLAHSIYNKKQFIIILISIHLTSLILLSLLGVGYRVRYLSVSEFIIFIVSIKFFVDSLSTLKKPLKIVK